MRIRFATFLTLSLAGCQSVENSLVYHPSVSLAPSEAPPAPLQDVDLKLPDGTAVHARWAPHPRAGSVILYCHGNGGNLDSWLRPASDAFQQMESSVLFFDYPGYGRSAGAPSEAGCYAAAEAAYRWLVDVQKIPPERILLWGESLGGAVAVELASRKPHRALVLVRTFTSLPEVGDDQLPLLPCSLLMTNRFDSLQRIDKCRSPVFIASAEEDRLVLPRHGKRLHAACTAPAELCVLRGIGHNDPLPSGFYDTLRAFLAAKAPMNAP
jgi:uncharacterized protein